MKDTSPNTQQNEVQAVIEDRQKYLEQLYAHKSKLKDPKLIAETQAEIEQTNNLLYKAVQEKHGIYPEQDTYVEANKEQTKPLTNKGITAMQGLNTSGGAEEDR